jgi:hypothetical protein
MVNMPRYCPCMYYKAHKLLHIAYSLNEGSLQYYQISTINCLISWHAGPGYIRYYLMDYSGEKLI